MTGLLQDLRLAVRRLRATPTFTIFVTLSMILGIGANTAIFSIVNSLLLRPLPVTAPEQLVTLATVKSPLGGVFSYALFDQVRQQDALHAGALAHACCRRGALRRGASEEPVDEIFVSGTFFSALGLRPHLGRFLAPADDVRGGAATGVGAVISYGLWTRLGRDPGVVGQSVTVDGAPVSIIGVAPQSFFGLEVGRTFDVALPFHAQPILDPAKPLSDDIDVLNVWLRLRPGMSVAAATTELRARQPQIRIGAMPTSPPSSDWMTDPFTLRPAAFGTSPLRERFQRPLTAILVLVALVLLVACANLANLLLARGIARRYELSVRLALGAARHTLVRQLLAESVVLAAVGAIGGLLFARWGSELLVRQLSTGMRTVALDLTFDWRVLAFVVGVVVVTVGVCGVAPALRATRVDPIAALREGKKIAGDGFGRWSYWMLAAQVAISVVLVVTAGLFSRTFERITRVSLGFEREHVLVATVTPTTVPATQRNGLYHQLVRAASEVPGVAGAGGSLNPPLLGTIAGAFVVSSPGTPAPPDAERIRQFMEITPGGFDAYGTKIRAGRDFTDHDDASGEPVMIVNEAFVRRFLRGRQALDTTLAVASRFGAQGEVPFGQKKIVGVVADAAYRSVRDIGQPTMYFPLAQRRGPLFYDSFFVTLRSNGSSPAVLSAQVSAAMRRVNPNLTVAFSAVSAQVRDALAQDRVVALLSGFFGVLALLLAGLGLYGVTAHDVGRQRAEIGVRLALGATPSLVRRRILARLTLPITLGVIVGVVASLGAARFVESLLFGVDSSDPGVFAGTIAALYGVGLMAGWSAASGAVRIDPASTIK